MIAAFLLALFLAAIPLHVKTWLYYGLNGINTEVPPQIMAAYADYVEGDVFESDRPDAFKAAGGKAAVAYTDPSFVAYCVPPFMPPAGKCDPVERYALPESAWFHEPDGTRTRRNEGEHFHYQEALNPASPATRRYYALYTRDLLQRAPRLDYFFADDSGGTLDGLFYGFESRGVEISTAEQLIVARRALFSAASRPVFINGNDPATWLPAYGGALVTGRNVEGEVHEGCFNADDYGLLTDVAHRWQRESESLLFNARLRRYAVCMMQGSMTPERRLYALASWWISYDERWSIAAPVNKAPDGYAVFPEFDIVPGSPRRTAERSIEELRRGNVYVREFARCRQRGTFIGPCAAVVNTGDADAAVPQLQGRYARNLELTPHSVVSGGTVLWSSGVPSHVEAGHALVLRGS
ncbi:MAG: hypothetical protein JO359_09740 [Candidatus Eremiobacteraeota bacterium]|nr:hypothetical protein [Candidatus Eremiobacteraeota bacterium]